MKVRCIKSIGRIEVGQILETVTKFSIPRIEVDGLFICEQGSATFEEHFAEVITMTKDDLKTGMVVEMKYERKIVLGNNFVGSKTHMRKNQYMDNLISNGEYRELDIIAVYQEPKFLKCIDDLDSEELVLLWQRETKSPAQLAIESLQAKKAVFDKEYDEKMARLKEEV